jgi:hypothetical protein
VARVVHTLSRGGRGRSSADHGGHGGGFTGGDEDDQNRRSPCNYGGEVEREVAEEGGTRSARGSSS